MKVAVISDTHARSVDDLPVKVLQALRKVDLIIHAGDFTEKSVLEGLRSMGDVRAVQGNMDSAELKSILPRQDVFLVNGRRAGLTHGSGAPTGIAGRVKDSFADEKLDIIVFGHSHEPFNRMVGATLMLNPGRARESFGVLTIEAEVDAEIVHV